jgi:hypothetical protein
MAFPILIELLTAGARAAFPMLTSLAETEISANEILRRVKELGYEIRRQTGLDIIGALRDNVNAARQFRMIADSTIPNPDRFGTALTSMIRNYSYRVKVGGNVEEYPEYISVSSNEVLNKDQIMGTVDSYLSNADQYGRLGPGMEYNLQVVDALKSPALG